MESDSAGAAHRDDLAAIVRRSRVAIAAAVLLVVGRGVVFTFWEQAAFNSDHAIVGLMAKHLAEGRAFPLFFYGQSYMLAVEAWLAAPLFLVAGPSLPALQLPLLVLNAVAASLLIVLLQKEVKIGPWAALGASLVFVLAPPATALGLIEANGGSVETFVYILLLWVFRHRPALFGLTLGFAFVHREFTLYALPALVLLRAASRRPLRAAAVRHAVVAAAWFCLAWGVILLLRGWSSPLGPGTSVAGTALPQTNVGELARRVCWTASALPSRMIALCEVHLPLLFGTTPRSLGALGITSRTAGQGVPGLSAVMLVALAVAVWRVLRGWRRRPKQVDGGFAAYLMLVGATSMAVYGALSCGPMSPDTLRYDLLGLFTVVGLAALFFAAERQRGWRAALALALVSWGSVSAWSHGRLLAEYLLAPPPNHARAATERLLADGVRRARGNYWIAYRFTFLTGERLVVASNGPVRITEYQELAGHAEVGIREAPCEGGTSLAGRFYSCPMDAGR